MYKPFPHYQQLDVMDCGPTCLRMIAKHYGRSYTLQNLRERSFITRQGVSMLGISDAAESIGFRTQGVRINTEQLIEDVPLPCILHWNQNHFVVLYNIRKKKGIFSKDIEYTFNISDPGKGKYPMDKAGFEKCWISTKSDNKDSGTALLLTPTPDFYERVDDEEKQKNEEKINILPENKILKIENVSFSYDGAQRDYVLEGLNLTIPQNKVTAIVGASGSGKTTIIKLLLGFYEPVKGAIKIDNYSLKDIHPQLWRQHTGAVMQEGFIFSDTIANNIAISEETVDKKKLLYAVETANIKDFIESLPLKYNSKIGMEGSGVSQGQKQRLLIARAVYKNPDFLFFDEATNALDANNEKIILDNLKEFYKGKTVVIVAHRLSTVQNADNIIVLEKGKVIEQGTHKELTAKKGAYYTLGLVFYRLAVHSWTDKYENHYLINFV